LESRFSPIHRPPGREAFALRPAGWTGAWLISAPRSAQCRADAPVCEDPIHPCRRAARPRSGCGDSTSESAADKSAAKAESEAKNQKPIAEPKPIAAQTATPTAGEADINSKPKVPKGSGGAPSALKAETLIAGNGAEIKSGQQATVNYVGVLFKTGKEFDTSWGKGKQPFQFALGSGQVIPGWDQGVAGMKVGAQGSPPKIGPNEPLIFDIDLKKIG
jgi:FKBP-type peptidyl-prolyl cis-trans isomerase